MFLQSVKNDVLSAAKRKADLYGQEALEFLQGKQYAVRFAYKVESKGMYYFASLRPGINATKAMVPPLLYLAVSQEGELLCPLDCESVPLLLYLYEKEKDLSQEELTAIYGASYERALLVEGLSEEEAKRKVDARDSFSAFLSKLEKEKEDPALPSYDSAGVKVAIEYGEYDDEFIFELSVITSKKEYPIRDMYRFLTGFKTQEVYPLSSKESIALRGESFVHPYSTFLPLLSSIGSFERKTKVPSVFIPFSAAASLFDALRGEVIVYNEKKIKITEKEGVMISLGEDGVPNFVPPFEEEGVTLLPGTKGVYRFFIEEKKIEFYPFLSKASEKAYLYFREKGLESFPYIQDLFKSALLPKLTSALHLQKGDKAEEFSISLYLTFDEEERLQFKTVYKEEGVEKKKNEIAKEYGRSLAEAYSVLLESLGGKENGHLEGKAIYEFLCKDLTPLTRICSLFADERIRPGKVSHIDGLRVKAKSGGTYLDFTLDHDLYSEEELRGILSSYHKKKRFFLLKDGLLLLDGEQIEEIDSLFQGDIHLDQAPAHALFSLTTSSLSVDTDSKAKEMLDSIRDFSSYKLPKSIPINADLRSYQKDGVRYLLALSKQGLGGILADEMGLGKTVQAIAYFTLLQEKGPSIVLCPKAVLYNWESEIKRFSSLPVTPIDGNREAREQIISSIDKEATHIYVIGFDTFRRDASLFEDIPFVSAFLDEAQSVKNAFSQRHQALSSLHAKHRFALTGTPLENSPMDLWAIFDFLMPGYLGGLRDFASKIESEAFLARLSLLLKPFILRRKKKDVLADLPEKTEEDILLSMEEDQRKVYLSYLRLAREKAENKEERIAFLASLTRLRQICVDPAMFLEDYDGTSSKLNYCVSALSQIIASGHKCIVFSSFKTALIHLKEMLEESEIQAKMITGDTPAKERLALASTFNQENTFPVMLVSLKAGGVGLNLIGADTVIHLDPWWNPSSEDQASDRVHRIGQTNNVTILRLIEKDSIEEKVQLLQKNKRDLFDDLVEGSGGASKLSEEDIAYLLS